MEQKRPHTYNTRKATPSQVDSLLSIFFCNLFSFLSFLLFFFVFFVYLVVLRRPPLTSGQQFLVIPTALGDLESKI